MKTIIIPAQGKSTFINLFKLSSNLFYSEPVNCIFVEVRAIPDNLNDLLTLRRNTTLSTPFDAAFIAEVTALQQNFGNNIHFITDYIYGDSPAVFRNYTQHHNCSLVMYDKQEWLNSKQKSKLDIFRMVSRSGCELMYISEGHTLLQDERTAINKNNKTLKPAPASILHQYNTITERLDVAQEDAYGKQVVSKKISNINRYFLSEQLLQNLLSQSHSSLLLVTK